MRGIRSSPSMWATLTRTPSRSAIWRTLSAHPAGLSPPALLTTLIPRSTQRAEHLLHLRQERRRIPELAVAGPLLVQDQHGQLGQPVAGQHIDVAAFDHLLRRRQPIAEEPAAVGDADGTIAGHAASILTNGWPESTCWPASHEDLGDRARDRRHDLVFHLHRFHRQQRLPGYDDVADIDDDPKDRSRHGRHRRTGTAGVVGRRVARWYDEAVLATRHEHDISVDLGLDELQCRQPLVGDRDTVDGCLGRPTPLRS